MSEHLLIGGFDVEVTKKDIKTIIKQPPNKKIIGFLPFHLWLYNLSNPTKYAENTVFVWPEGSIYFENTKLGLDNISQLFDKKFKPGQKIIFGATNLKNNKV